MHNLACQLLCDLSTSSSLRAAHPLASSFFLRLARDVISGPRALIRELQVSLLVASSSLTLLQLSRQEEQAARATYRQHKAVACVRSLLGKSRSEAEESRRLRDELERLLEASAPPPHQASNEEEEEEVERGSSDQPRKRRKRPQRLRSRNAYVDAFLEEEDGLDSFADLEDFIVCDERDFS
eukprot:19820-Hanusia_phi.AAC.3